MKKIACTFLLLMLLGILTGCQFKDIDKRAFVVELGIDRPQDHGKQDQFEVTLRIAIPEGDPTQRSQESITITEVAESIPEAVRLMKSKVDREIDFSHCKVVIIGESFAKGNITPVMDWSTRRRDIQLIMLYAVGIPNAKEVVKMHTKSERLPGNALILALTKDGSESPFIVSAYNFDVSRRTKEHGLDPFMPIVETKNPDMLIINKVALFNKQKMVATLTPDETRMLNLLLTRNLRTSFKVNTEVSSFDYNLESSSSKYRIKAGEGGKAVVMYRLSGRASLEENSTGVPVTGPVLRLISKAASEKLEKDTQSLLKKIHSTGTDPLGWGLRYYSRSWRNHTEQRDWAEKYPNLEFQVKADLKVKYTGVLR